MSSKFTPSEGTLCLHAAANIRRSLSSSIRFDYFTGLEHCNLLLIMEKITLGPLSANLLYILILLMLLLRTSAILYFIVAVINAACVNLLSNKI